MKRLTQTVCTVFAILMFAHQPAIGETVSPQLASTSELPKALAALDQKSVAILPVEQAKEIRANWILGFSMPLVDVGFQGSGKLNLTMTTQAGGVYADDPIRIRIRLGR